jgi:hypothetical protein
MFNVKITTVRQRPSQRGGTTRNWGPRRVLANAVYVFLEFAVLVTAIGCSESSNYAVFFSRVKSLDFTFQYPREWAALPVEQYGDLVTFSVLGPENPALNEKGVTVAVSVRLGLGAGADGYAQLRVNEEATPDSNAVNFILLRKGIVDLDGVKGYVAENTADFLTLDMAPGSSSYIHSRILFIAVPREGRTYELWINATQVEWNARAGDIQHVLDPFRWR